METVIGNSMKAFYNGLGLNDYPFNVFTAENESQYANDIFVHPYNYDAIKSSFDSNRSIIIRGNRGTGKTALLYDLRMSVDLEKNMLCVIDDYSDLDLHPTNSEYYSLIIHSLVSTLFLKLFDDKGRISKLSKEDKLFLSALLSEYTNQITQSELTRKIDAIQLSSIQRFIKKNVNFIRVALNYGLTAALNVLNDAVRNYLGALPPITESQIREIMPSISFETETEFNKANISYNLLIQICTIIKKLGYANIIVFFDKFDEDSRMENNADVVSEFIVPLLTDNKLLENQFIQIIVSVWEVPFSKILSKVRSQKHHCPLLEWPDTKLRDALNQRLRVFSNGQINSFEEILANDIDENLKNTIFTLSNGNPRDLWHICDSIFKVQYGLDPGADRLSKEAVNEGLRNFVVGFNFYEYYPRKAGAKANSMDIYGYIKHLLKLADPRFTKNQLNEAAKTGSSTNNYVVSMETIGLIVNTNEKEKGGVIYKINDPKVIYAMENRLDISKK